MADLADAIWGPLTDEDAQRLRLESLSSYFEHCEGEIDFVSRAQRRKSTALSSHDTERVEGEGDFVSRSHAEAGAFRETLLVAIKTLRAAPVERRNQVGKANESSVPSSISCHSSSSSEAGSPSRLPFALAIKVMYGTACMAPDTVGGDIFRPAWKESESLSQYFNRIYPRYTETMQDSRAVQVHKLSMGYLSSYSSLEVRWTSRLSDHLVILRGEDWKSLYIFRHPSFLRMALETLRADDPDLGQSMEVALGLGCLPPGLLHETIMTINLLFPGAGDQHSRTILEREVSRHNLDPWFLEPSLLHDEPHERLRDALDPADVRTLYEKYPYWGERLYEIWREADDPTPVTAIERWSEAKRNPRFTYWCTVVAVCLAVLFGVVATSLAAVQAWIAYCDWLGDEGRPLCKVRRS